MTLSCAIVGLWENPNHERTCRDMFVRSSAMATTLEFIKALRHHGIGFFSLSSVGVGFIDFPTNKTLSRLNFELIETRNLR